MTLILSEILVIFFELKLECASIWFHLLRKQFHYQNSAYQFYCQPKSQNFVAATKGQFFLFLNDNVSKCILVLGTLIRI